MSRIHPLNGETLIQACEDLKTNLAGCSLPVDAKAVMGVSAHVLETSAYALIIFDEDNSLDYDWAQMSAADRVIAGNCITVLHFLIERMLMYSESAAWPVLAVFIDVYNKLIIARAGATPGGIPSDDAPDDSWEPEVIYLAGYRMLTVACKLAQ